MQMRYVEMTDAHYDAMKQARIYKAYSFIVGGMLYAAFLKEKTFLMSNCLFQKVIYYKNGHVLVTT